ncbi:MAG: hypothetical protein ACI3YC_05340 [Alloprevotella sp.]
MLHPDGKADATLNTKWMLRNTYVSGYQYMNWPGGSNTNLQHWSVDDNNNYTEFTAVTVDESGQNLTDKILQPTGMGDAKAIVATDAETAARSLTESDATDAYTWSLVKNTAGWVLKNTAGRYLTWDGTTVGSSTDADDAACVWQEDHNSYNKQTLDPARLQFRLGADPNYALGVTSEGTLTFSANYDSRFSLIRPLTDKTNLSGAVYPKLSSENEENWYQLTFLTNGLGDDDRHLDATTPTSIVGAASVAESEVQGWKLVPYGTNGDFYIVNTGGKYLTHATDHYEIKDYSAGNTTVFRLVEDEINRNAFQIVMALSGSSSNTLGMASTTDHVVRETTLATASTDFTYLSAAPYTPRTECYIQFSGWGRTVLTELSDGSLGVTLTEESTPADPACNWELIYQASGAHVRNGNGNYLKQNADGSFSLTASEAEATAMVRTTNTYLNSAMVRWHLKSKADNAVLGLKNGVLTTGLPENSRYTLLRMEKDIRGGKMPALTTDTETKWNYVKMVYNPNRYVRYNKTSQTLTSPQNPSLVYNQKYFYMWSLEEANELGDFYLKNFFGEYFRENSGLKTTTEKANATVVRLCERLDRVDGSHDFTQSWAIRIGSGGSYFMVDGSDVGTWGDASVGTKVEFEEVSLESDDAYVLFSALSSQPLFEGADGNSPCAQFKTSPDQDQAGFIWIPEFVDDMPTQTRLKSGNGKYIAYDGTAFSMTENAAEAYLFNLQSNAYESATGEVRFQLLSTDGTQALGQTNVAGGPLEWVLPDSRYSVIRFAEFPSGPEHPLPTTSQADMTLYYLRFPNSGKVMQDAGAGEDIIGADPSASMSKLWAIMPVQTGGQDLGDYVFISALGNFLKRNGSEMETTSNIDEATTLRPVEFTSLLTTWQAQIMNVSGLDNRALQYAGANPPAHENNWIGYGYVSAGTANNNLLFEKADIYPDFFEEGSGAWRYLQMLEVTGDPVLAVNGDPAALTTETANRLQGQFWQNIGNEFNFILKNGTGKYLCYDDDGNLILSADTIANPPAHFYLWLNRSNIDDEILWSICPLADDGTMPATPSSFLKLNDDNTLSLAVPYPASTETEALAKGAFYFGENMMPKFSNDTEKTYFFINFKDFTPDNLYLSDGVGDVFDAKGEEKEVRNDMLWCYNGTAYGFKLESKNGQFLCWNQTNKTFDVTKDADKADLFTYLPLSDTYSGYFKLVGGPNTTDEGGNPLLDDSDVSIIGQYLTLQANADGTYDVVLTTTVPEVGMTLEDVVEAEDYTQFRIIPKRSWLVKEVSGEPDNIRPGFIQPSEEGWSVNPYTGEKVQKTNEFKLTVYMKQGEKRPLLLPTTMQFGTGYVNTWVRAYQRWYDYKTGGRIPSARVAFNQQSKRNYANGTVMGSLLNLNGQTNGEFVGSTFDFQMPDQCAADYSYIVGMDASMFTDFVDYFGDNGNSAYDASSTSSDVVLPKNDNLIEPTLSGRYIYEIRNAREMADKLMACTKGSTKWLENQTIHFPKKKRGYHSCTIPLQNELQNYWFYKEGIVDEEHLQNIIGYDYIEFQVDAQGDAVGSGENPACIQGFGITDWPVMNAESSTADLGNKRFIVFKYPGESADGSNATEALGDSCVIKVYARDGGTAGESGAKAMYQLARIVLYFDNDTEPRPFTDVIGLNDAGTDFKSTRSPEHLKKVLGAPVASITFDTENYLPYQTPPFGRHTAGQQGNGSPLHSYELTYRFPIQYDNCSYCFQPVGGVFNNPTGAVTENTWGSYTIVSRFKQGYQSDYSFYSMARNYNKVYGESYNDPSNSAFIYIDASEQPGTIASIKYDSKLCSGSRLYVSAWISSVNPKGVSPANIILTVQGRTVDGRIVDLYKYCPGPFCMVARSADGSDITKLDTHGIWQQIYFSFVNNSTEDIREYLLNIDNACTNSAGGDIMIDDVEVFANQPEIQVAKTTPVCGNEVTLVKMTSDYVGLLQTLGLEINQPTPNGINPKLWYCLVDSLVYQQTLESSISGHAEGVTTSDIRNAFYAGLVGDRYSKDPSIYPFHSIELHTMYDDIPVFQYKDALNDTLSTSILRREEVDGTKYIVISDRINAEKLKANTKYYLVFVVRYGDDPITYNDAWEQFQMGTDCVIASVFKTGQPFKILGNGDKESSVDENTIGVCAGQSVQIGMDMEGIDTDTGDTEEQIRYYDWWLDYVWAGFAKVYITAGGEPVVRELSTDILPTDTGLRVALQNLRHFFPNAVSLSEVTPKQDELGIYELTTAMIEGLAKLTEPTPDVRDGEGNIVTPGHIAPLVLHQPTLNVTISSDIAEDTKQNITVIPIEPETLDPDVTYCYEPQELHVMVDGKAPGMKDGQTDTSYPTYMNNVPVRLSLVELAQARVAADADNFADVPGTQIQVPLRDITTADASSPAVGMQELYFDDGGGTTYAPIYLTATNDPDMEVFTATGTGPNNLEMKRIGRITALEANKNDGKEHFMRFYFFKEFQPKEGYTYTIQLNFEEKYSVGDEPEEKNKCNGTLLVDLKMVPSNLIWTGAAGNGDWTNDRNWARADGSELHTGAGYLTNAENKSSNAFVPIHSTNVIIAPGATAPDLYAVTNNTTEDKTLVGDLDENNASKDIQYELKIQKETDSNNNFNCSSFRTYQVNNVVIQAGAELLHTERLAYNKAWMEYALDADRWYTLGVPLKGVYAGDWYAPTTTGKQETEYFKDVTFNTTDYDRFSPAVYQRGWDKGEAKLYYLNTPTDPSTVASTPRDVAIRADWSASYNDVNVYYGEGGFSLKTKSTNKTGTPYAQLLFRVPKEDASYEYFVNDNDNGSNSTGIDRVGKEAGRFFTDDGNGTFTLTATNHVANNRFFLVGNPFACGLDMTKFFAANAGLEKKYWILTASGQTAVMRGDNATGWIAANSEGTFTTDGILAPGQGFFVKAATPGTTLTANFTPEMQTSAGATQTILRAPASPFASLTPTLQIVASRGGLRSEAIVIKQTESRNDFRTEEDLETLLDATQSDAPTVYTMAGHQAATINQRRAMHRLPLGIYSSSDETTLLTFKGLHTFNETLSLLDNLTGEITPLTLNAQNGIASVEVAGNAAGRYFILSSETSTEDVEMDDAADARPMVMADKGKVTITSCSAHPLTFVHIVGTDGRTLYRMTPFTPTLTVPLSPGVYVIECRTDEAVTNAKVTVM